MRNCFAPRLTILPEAQRRLWPQLAAVSLFGMVLYGGTAIALRLGHRTSVDHDLFSAAPLDKPGIGKRFPFIPASLVLQDAPDTYTVLAPVGDGAQMTVKVSFFGGIGFGRVGEPSWTEDGVMQVASLDDLLATKLNVMLQRVEAKDYLDIAAMIEADVSLPKALASAKLMYGNSFQPSECLKALVYFQGGDLDTLTLETKHILIDAASRVRELPPVVRLSETLVAADCG